MTCEAWQLVACCKMLPDGLEREKMNLDEYKFKVIELAIEKSGLEKVCCDTIKDSYKNNLSILQAVDEVISDSYFWEFGI